ncbi:SCO7613 C-terminal domain-containing membrane protein [Micromonospora sp. NPDC047557]|uniref:SCO7613 C-terminal domain-containing membrane protein n=1 Tax=Micromonospora sp. NPDC047557 TaxID=3364250 RepID=UPI00371535D4
MDDTRYPCPACGAPADLNAGCAGCRRPPDRIAAEVVRLGREVDRLGPEVERAHRTYTELAGRLAATSQRRAELAAVVRAGLAAGAPVVGPAPVVTSPPPLRVVEHAPPGAAETSTRTVQGLLFVLGGLLLGTAAVVFTAVAWASVGVGGRALILAAVTALVLAGPLLAVRRGLRGTAETFAAVGLLLVLLDGYAAWSVDLGHVTGWPGTRYAALVGGVSAAVFVAYGRLSGLTGPWFAGLVVAQPVLPLLAAQANPGADGWVLVLLGVAVLNLAVLVALRDGNDARRLAGRVLAGLGHVGALVGAAACAVVPLVLGRSAGSPLLAGVPMLLVAVTGLVAALLVGGTAPRAVAAGLLMPVLAAAVLRPVGELRPSLLLLAAATVALVLAGAVRLLPTSWRPGPRSGALLVAAGAAQVAVAIAGVLAVAAAARSLPPWHGAGWGPDLSWGWQVAPAVALALGAAASLLPRRAWAGLATAGAVVVLLAVPIGWTASWATVVAVDLAGGVALVLAVLARPTTRPATLLGWAAGGAVLIGHALLVALADPLGVVVVLGISTVLGVALAVRTADGPYRRVAGVGLLAAHLALPAIAAVSLFAAGVQPWWQARAALLAAGLSLVAALAVRRHRVGLIGYAVTGAVVAVLAAGVAPLVAAGNEPVTPYAALAALGVALVARWGLPALGDAPDGPAKQTAVGGPSAIGGLLRASGVVLAGVAVLAALPTILIALVIPYGVPGSVWSGAPTATADRGLFPTGLALVALAVAAALAGGRVRPPLLAGLPFAAAALPVLLVAIGVPWPVLPAATLLAGVSALLLAALAAPRPALASIAVPVGVALAVAGVAVLLATRAGTLAAEGTLLVTAVIVAVGARMVEARVVGSLAAVGAACALAVTAPFANGLELRAAAYPLLGVAVLVLAAAALASRRPAPVGRVLDTAAQAVAGVAAALTVEVAQELATVCVLWGTAVALRLLRRGEPAGRRWRFAAIAAGSELIGAWVLLAAGGVSVLEAYTLPAAGLALGAGLLALRTRPGLTSWPALGPGLVAALLPSLVSVLAGPDPQPWRRLLLGAAALGAVLAGATRRWQAPVLLGGAVLAVLALHEIARGWDLLPRWIYLGVGGLALIGLAASYERRRRDLARLRAAVARLG